jgi:hypothetical protein
VSAGAQMSGRDPLSVCDEQGRCITCADEGVAMRVLRVERERSVAICVELERELVDRGGETSRGAGEAAGRAEVAIDFVEPVAVGEELLVHAGVALGNLGRADGPLARRGG